MPVDVAALPLGKKAAANDHRDLIFAHYDAGLPAPPPAVTLSAKVSQWPMFFNDAIGDCAIACPAHEIECWSANARGQAALVKPASVLKAYEDVSGYRPADPNNPTTNDTDVGCVVNDVLNYWRRTGIGGDKITAFVRLDPTSDLELRQAIDLFGGVYLGVQLPLSAQGEIGRVWTVHRGASGQAGSWGGHAINLVDYTSAGYTCVTWGALQRMTRGFVHHYADEAFAVLSADWMGPSGKSPQGWDMPALQADLGQFHA